MIMDGNKRWSKLNNVGLKDGYLKGLYKIKDIVKICIEENIKHLMEIRKNRMNSLKEIESTDYTDLEKVSKEVEEAKKLFKKYNWPTVDVSRKSVEETAASVIKIYEIAKNNG